MKTTNIFKTNKLFILCILASLTFFAACKKEDKVTIPSTPTNTTKTDYLTKAPWKYHTIRNKYGNDPWIDVTAFFPPCYMDGTMTFLKNNTVTEDEGATKCDPSDPQTNNGVWSLDNNGSTLTMDGEVSDIDVLDNTTLKVIGTVGLDTLVEVTFLH